MIIGFKEIKALDKDGKKDNPRQPTVQFDVDYTYKSLYPKISKLRELAALIKSFKVTKDVIFEEIKEEPKTKNELTDDGDQEWV
ncbi:hypothetical protein D3C76_1723640 [compost metagenome]